MPTHEHLPVPNPHLYNFIAHGSNLLLRATRGGVYYTGANNLEIEGGLILTPNHRTWRDIPALGYAALKAGGIQLHSMAKQELWDPPLVGNILDACGAFPVDRDSRQFKPETMDHMRMVASKGGALEIFAQGTRMPGIELERNHLKAWAAVSALILGLPIVPVWIAGTESGAEKPIVNAFGEPIRVEQMGENIRDVIEFVRPVMDDIFTGLITAKAQAEQFQANLQR